MSNTLILQEICCDEDHNVFKLLKNLLPFLRSNGVHILWRFDNEAPEHLAPLFDEKDSFYTFQDDPAHEPEDYIGYIRTFASQNIMIGGSLLFGTTGNVYNDIKRAFPDAKVSMVRELIEDAENPEELELALTEMLASLVLSQDFIQDLIQTNIANLWQQPDALSEQVAGILKQHFQSELEEPLITLDQMLNDFNFPPQGPCLEGGPK